MDDIKPLSHGYFHVCDIYKWLNDDCDLCNGRWGSRCYLVCKLCRLEEPEVLVPLLTAQRKLLRTVLKDLWGHIDVVLDSNPNTWKKKIMARELCHLLSSCESTRDYLDTESGKKGWANDVLQRAKDLMTTCCRQHKCECPKENYLSKNICWHCVVCEKERDPEGSDCSTTAYIKKRKRQLLVS